MKNTIISLIKKFLKYVFAPLLIIASIWVSYFLLYGNFHKVDKDIYRSAQLFTFNMPYYIEKPGIKSILNLRKDTHKTWHEDEIAIAKEYDINHYDYGIGDRRVQTVEKMNDILELIKKAPKPLLIHCKAGADRTGLAVALYLSKIKKQDDAQSKGLSILYGHFPWFGSKTVAMDKSFDIYINQ